jgi:hypothetical protein
MQPERTLCPSAPAKSGALLLGLVTETGDVAMMHQKMPIDEDFLETARAGRPLNERFRFASPCATKGCANWSGQHCMVLDIVRQFTPIEPVAQEELPRCAIRPECRWFAQDGAEACRLCPRIRTSYGALTAPDF